LLHLAAVGVEDPVVHRGAGLAWRLEHQSLVEADPGIAVGETAEGVGGGSAGGGSVENDEVVAESMHLREVHRRILA